VCVAEVKISLTFSLNGFKCFLPCSYISQYVVYYLLGNTKYATPSSMVSMHNVTTQLYEINYPVSNICLLSMHYDRGYVIMFIHGPGCLSYSSSLRDLRSQWIILLVSFFSHSF